MNNEVNTNTGAIVIDTSREKIDKLKKKWIKINKMSTNMTTIAGSGFLLTLLSPLDFEGRL